MKPAFKMGWQMLVYHIIAMVLSLMFVSMLGSALWLQIILSLALLAAYCFMLYSDGCSRGERAATLSVQTDRQREVGRAVDPDLAQDCFKPSTAWKGYLIGICLTALIAICNIVAEPFFPPFQPMSDEELSELNASMQTAQQQLAMQPELEAGPEGELVVPDETPAPAVVADEAGAADVRINPFNIVARIVFTPFLFLYTPLQHHAVLLNWLFLVLALAVPLLAPIGYLQGPRLRQKKLIMIEQGKKRKMRNLKVNKKPRGPKGPKMEV